MLDYIFFHRIPFDRFVAFLHEKGIRPETECNDDGFEVRVPENLVDALSDEVDARLPGRLMAELPAEELGHVDNAIVDAVEDPDSRSLCQRMRDGG